MVLKKSEKDDCLCTSLLSNMPLIQKGFVFLRISKYYNIYSYIIVINFPNFNYFIIKIVGIVLGFTRRGQNFDRSLYK